MFNGDVKKTVLNINSKIYSNC